MEVEQQCRQCGHTIPRGEIHFPFCAGQPRYLRSLQRRDTFLLMTLVLLILMFAITGVTVRIYREGQKAFAQEMYDRGERALRARRVTAALADFRAALSYSHNNPDYELRLAEALTAAGNSAEAHAEARTYFLSLLEREPGNGIVNLELARLAADDRDVPDALRYYHGAIYGQWGDHQVEKRRSARLELVEFLLAIGQKDAARAELIAIAPDLPPDPILQTRVGTLLLQVKGYDDALTLFHRALLEDPHLPAALAGAGECHFQQGHYAQAERYLARALREAPNLPEAAIMKATCDAVLNLDPFQRHLSNAERARRAVANFQTATARLQECAAIKGIDLKAADGDRLQMLYSRVAEVQPHVQQRYLSRDSELLSKVMDVVFDIEQTTERVCGEPQSSDLALLLLAQEQGGSHP